MTDDVLENLMFPKDKSAMNKRMPDYAYIRKELLRNSVSNPLADAIMDRIVYDAYKINDGGSRHTGLAAPPHKNIQS